MTRYLFGRIAALLILLLILPILFILWSLVLIKLGSPALFVQARPALRVNMHETLDCMKFTE